MVTLKLIKDIRELEVDKWYMCNYNGTPYLLQYLVQGTLANNKSNFYFDHLKDVYLVNVHDTTYVDQGTTRNRKARTLSYRSRGQKRKNAPGSMD